MLSTEHAQNNVQQPVVMILLDKLQVHTTNHTVGFVCY